MANQNINKLNSMQTATIDMNGENYTSIRVHNNSNGESIQDSTMNNVNNNYNENYQIVRINHNDRLSSAFESMFSNEMLCDVTIICNGRAIKAHRLMLAAASSYFKEIFNQHIPNGYLPIIFLKNFNNEDLNDILEFIYTGKLTLPMNRVNSLIDSAKSLGVGGLSTLRINVNDHYENVNNNQNLITTNIANILNAKNNSQSHKDNVNSNTNNVNNSSDRSAPFTNSTNNSKSDQVCISNSNLRGRGRKRKLKTLDKNNQSITNDINDLIKSTDATNEKQSSASSLTAIMNNDQLNGVKMSKSNGLDNENSDKKISIESNHNNITASNSSPSSSPLEPSSSPSVSSLSSASLSPPKSISSNNDKSGLNETNMKTMTNEKLSQVESSSSAPTSVKSDSNDQSCNKSGSSLSDTKPLDKRNGSIKKFLLPKTSLNNNDDCDQQQPQQQYDKKFDVNNQNNNAVVNNEADCQSSSSSSSVDSNDNSEKNDDDKNSISNESNSSKKNIITQSKLRSWSQQISQKNLAAAKSSSELKSDKDKNGNKPSDDPKSTSSKISTIKYEMNKKNLITAEPRRGRPPKFRNQDHSDTKTKKFSKKLKSSAIKIFKSKNKKNVKSLSNNHCNGLNGNSSSNNENNNEQQVPPVKRSRGRPQAVKRDPKLAAAALNDPKLLMNIVKSNSQIPNENIIDQNSNSSLSSSSIISKTNSNIGSEQKEIINHNNNNTNDTTRDDDNNSNNSTTNGIENDEKLNMTTKATIIST